MNLDSFKRDLVVELAESLAKNLPEIGGGNWWEIYVLNELTPAQRYQVELLQNPDIYQLDMAALLRLFNRNWSELALKKNYPKNASNFIRELISARNRWAHEPASGHDLEDLHRDLDTAKRFLSIISENKDLLEKIDSYRIQILETLANKQKKIPSSQNPYLTLLNQQKATILKVQVFLLLVRLLFPLRVHRNLKMYLLKKHTLASTSALRRPLQVTLNLMIVEQLLLWNLFRYRKLSQMVAHQDIT